MARIQKIFGVWDRGMIGSRREAKDRLVARYTTRKEAEQHTKKLHKQGRKATWGVIY